MSKRKEKKQAKKQAKKEKKQAKKAARKERRAKMSTGHKIADGIAIALVVVIIVGIVAIGLVRGSEANYVLSAMNNAISAVNDGSWEDDVANAGTAVDTTSGSESQLEEFVPGTYGGIEFNTKDDVVNYYVEAYNYTKSLTAQYKEKDGGTSTFYKMVGTEELSIGTILVDGKENSIVNGLIDPLMSAMYDPNVYGLPPCTNRNPDLDEDEYGNSLTTSMLVPDDILAVTVKENDDGTITMELQPEESEMSHIGLDSQGKMFSTLGAIDDVVESLGVVTWAQGSTEENCMVHYRNGVATVTIDPSTSEIIEADYIEIADVDVVHANITVITDKSAWLEITYTMHFPADDDYIMDTKGLTRV